MKIDPNMIISTVADYYHINLSEIKSRRRKMDLIKYKHISIYFIKQFTELSLTRIGQEFPGRNGYLDHATVLHAIQSVGNQIDTNKGYKKQVDEIKSKIFDEIESIININYKRYYEVYQENDFYTLAELSNN